MIEENFTQELDPHTETKREEGYYSPPDFEEINNEQKKDHRNFEAAQ